MKIFFANLIKKIEYVKISDGFHQLTEFFHMLVNIAYHHKRIPNFFNKIENILKIFEDSLKKYSNYEIFQIFSSNKRILLFLIKEKLLVIDDHISHIMISDKYIERQYHTFFYPEIEAILKKGPDEIKQERYDSCNLPIQYNILNNTRKLCFNEENIENGKDESEEEENDNEMTLYEEEEENMFNEKNIKKGPIEKFEENRNIGENEDNICKLILK